MKVKFLGIAIASSLVLVPSVARAEWVEVAQSNRGGTIYVENSSIIRASVNQVKFVNRLESTIGEGFTASIVANCSTSQFQKQEVLMERTRLYAVNTATEQFPIEQAAAGTLIGASIQYACGIALNFLS